MQTAKTYIHKEEINGSSDYDKPIMAVNPWAQKRTSIVVTDAADKFVGWNKKLVVNKIWNLYK